MDDGKNFHRWSVLARNATVIRLIAEYADAAVYEYVGKVAGCFSRNRDAAEIYGKKYDVLDGILMEAKFM